ncbi:MAG: PhoH family protein [Planctomycetes bacterium]|nr:PhoH family protein [Planctomycetota bacterium]
MKATIDLPDTATAHILLGPNDMHQRMLRERLGVKITLRGHQLTVEGDNEKVKNAITTIEQMVEVIDPADAQGFHIDELQWFLAGAGESPDGVPTAIVLPGSKKIEAKSDGQARYIEAMHRKDVVFSIGPAGTGKTYLAVGCAVEALKLGRVRRIVLARPAVEAGERLGFLPGDMRDKVNPYLRPLYDSLGDMLTRAQLRQYLETGVIEVAPLAFMRGRTLNRAFVILDEAQNTTPGQMKMFLTRLGEHSHAVVTGDDTQIDLEESEQSGLIHAQAVLKGIEGIAFVHLSRHDVVRHRLVREIIKAYENIRGGA